MDSIAKRMTSGLLAFWFFLFTLVVPITANAATYNAAANLTGRGFYVPGVGTGVAGSPVLAAGATLLGRANPWIAAITIGTPIMQHLLDVRNNGQIAIGSDASSFPTPAGWADSDTPPANADPIVGGNPVPATNGTTVVPRGVGTCYVAQSATWVGQLDNAGCMAKSEELTLALNPGLTYQSGWYTLTAATATNGPQMRRKFSKTPAGPWFDMDARSDVACPVDSTFNTTTKQCETFGPVCPDGLPVVQGQCYPQTTCPPGYSINYDSCILTNNALPKWPDSAKDNRPSFIPDPANSGKFQANPRDPDPIPTNPTNQLSAAQVIASLQNASQEFTQDEFGNPTSTQVQANPQGGYTFTQQVQTTNNNQTYTTTNTYTTNKQGDVINVATVTNNGPITNISSTPANPIEFPDDYNKELTQQKILTGEGAADHPDWATDIATKTAEEKQKIDAKLDEIPGQFQADKNSWFAWIWTPPVGQCSPFTGSVRGKSVTWDLCSYIANIRDIVGWLFAIAGTWLIYNEMFRRET